jgi:HAD superfamily hydrolase (TIGR01509 family)
VNESAAELVARKKHLLVDFDGPICAVFGSMSDRTVAKALIKLLRERGRHLCPDIDAAADPFDVLRYSATLPDPDDVRAVEAEMRRLEVAAVHTAPPTTGALPTLRRLVDQGHTVTVVSNNSDDAVHTYLALHDATEMAMQVSSRSDANLDHLKPEPFLLHQAMHTLGASPSECVMIGDSLSDLQAARHAETASIAHANKPGKGIRLLAEGPDALIQCMTELLP